MFLLHKNDPIRNSMRIFEFIAWIHCGGDLKINILAYGRDCAKNDILNKAFLDTRLAKQY